MKKPKVDHRFLDEAGDTTFYGKGKIPILGKDGVSRCFQMGLVRIKGDLNKVRDEIRELAKKIELDPFFKEVPSVQKRISSGGFFFHAKDDNEAVRKIFFDFLRNLNFSFQAVVAEKIYSIFSRKHNNKDSEFYADLLSHLLKDKLNKKGKMVLNIAQRNNSTNQKNLDSALKKAMSRKKVQEVQTEIVFNVQDHRIEPILNIVDYMCWCVQRVFERGELRYINLVEDKIRLIVDLYDEANYKNYGNYYNYPQGKKLTKANKKGPHEH